MGSGLRPWGLSHLSSLTESGSPGYNIHKVPRVHHLCPKHLSAAMLEFTLHVWFIMFLCAYCCSLWSLRCWGRSRKRCLTCGIWSWTWHGQRRLRKWQKLSSERWMPRKSFSPEFPLQPSSYFELQHFNATSAVTEDTRLCWDHQSGLITSRAPCQMYITLRWVDWFTGLLRRRLQL